MYDQETGWKERHLAHWVVIDALSTFDIYRFLDNQVNNTGNAHLVLLLFDCLELAVCLINKIVFGTLIHDIVINNLRCHFVKTNYLDNGKGRI